MPHPKAKSTEVYVDEQDTMREVVFLTNTLLGQWHWFCSIDDRCRIWGGGAVVESYVAEYLKISNRGIAGSWRCLYIINDVVSSSLILDVKLKAAKTSKNYSVENQWSDLDPS